MKTRKTKYYSLQKILELGCLYNIIIGERSNGKTFSVQEKIIKDFWSSGGVTQGAIIRRWEEDFRGKRGASTFDGITNANKVKEITEGAFDRVIYYSNRWYLGKWDEKLNKPIRSEIPFCFAFALTQTEHDKSSSYNNVKNILFDEFISRDAYLPDEFVKFMNTLSTIIRDRNNVLIFMLGNTVNRYCPYFTDMGLRNVINMQRGAIDVYTYGQSELRVAVEYCAPYEKGKKSDVYFAFDNPKLNMITSGEWEIAIYPHLPCKYNRDDVRLEYFVIFNGETLHCEIIQVDDKVFTYVHRKTTEIRNPDSAYVFTEKYDARPTWHRKLTKPKNDIERLIYSFYLNDKVFYQDNEVGETMRNYLLWSNSDRGIL